MELVLVLIVAGLAVLAFGWIRAHPKPADEALPNYVEDVAEGVAEEVKDAAVEVVQEVKKVVRKRKTPTTPTE